MSSIGHIYPSLEVFKFYLKTAEDRTGSDFEEAFIRRAWSGVTKFGESYRWSDGDKRLLADPPALSLTTKTTVIQGALSLRRRC